MLLNNRSVVLGQDGQTNSGGDIIPNLGSPGQSGGSRNDIDMLIKVCLTNLYHASTSRVHKRYRIFFAVYSYLVWID
jgi:hypothetical protein